MRVALLTADLVCSSRLAGAAQRAGGTLLSAATAEALLALLASEPADAVLIDLEAPGSDPAALVPRLRALDPAPRAVLAFGPHVHEQRLAAAQQAGCDAVYARGQLHAQAETILRELADK
jgi:DNA-binding NarL/FixJ family response regulator